MKTFLIICLFISSLTKAQNRKHFVLDKETKVSIEQANIDFLNGNGTHTDNKGSFSIDAKVAFVSISCIGYNTLRAEVKRLTDTVFLERSSETLKEVVVKEKRSRQRIFPKKGFNDFLPENFGSDGNTIKSGLIKAVYIPNENRDTTKIISKIIIHPTDYTLVYLGEKNKHKKQKDQKHAPFKINLYTVDTVLGIPIKRIFEKDITVQLKEGGKKLIYELTLDQQLNFPIEGVFIAFSSFKKAYYEAIGFKTGPGFRTIGISENSKFKVYEKSFAFFDDNDSNAKWFRDQYMWDRNNTYYVGLEMY